MTGYLMLVQTPMSQGRAGPSVDCLAPLVAVDTDVSIRRRLIELMNQI